MMMREQQWDRSNCCHFQIDVCLHQRIYMREFVNARNNPINGVLANICKHRVLLFSMF